MDLSEINVMFGQRRYQEALDHLERVSISGLGKEQLITYYDLTCKVHSMLDNHIKVEDLTSELLGTHFKEGSLGYFQFLNHNIAAQYNQSKFDESLQTINRYKPVLFQQDNKQFIPHKVTMLRQEGKILMQHNQFNKSESALSQSYELAKDNQLVIEQGLSQKQLGNLCYFKGDLEQAIEHYSQAMETFAQINEERHTAELKNNLAIIYSDRGEIVTAITMLQECLEINQRLGGKRDISDVLNNLGVLFKEIGEIHKAKEYFETALTLRLEVGNQQNIAGTKSNLGILHTMINEFDIALNYHEEALELDSKTGNPIFIADNYFNLFLLHSQLGNDKQASFYLEKLGSIQTSHDTEKIQHFYQLSQAIFLKQSKRRKHQYEAQKMLELLLKEDNLVNELREQVVLRLCEMLIEELEIYGEQDILTEIEFYINELVISSRKNNSFLILGELYILQARLAIYNNDIDLSKRLLLQAQLIAEEKGLKYLEKMVSQEFDEILVLAEKITDLGSMDPAIDEVFSLSQLGNMVRSIANGTHQHPTSVNDSPIMILIISKNGNAMLSKEFVPLESSEHLIANFLSAINSFMNVIFQETGTVERIRLSDYTVIMQAQGEFLFCYIFQGSSYYAVKRLDNLIETCLDVNFLQHLAKDYPKISHDTRVTFDSFVQDIFQ